MSSANLDSSFEKSIQNEDESFEKEVSQFQIIQNFTLNQPCRAFAFSGDNSTLVIGSGCDILVYQHQNNHFKKENQLQAHHSCVSNLLYSKSSDWFVSAGSWNDKLILWQKSSPLTWSMQEFPYKDNLTKELEVYKLMINQQENEIIVALDYNYMLVWQLTDENVWKRNQQIQVVQKGFYKINHASYSNTYEKLICFTENKSILIYIQNKNKIWKKYQCININCQNSQIYYYSFLDQFYVFRTGGLGITIKLNKLNELYEESNEVPESNVFELISQSHQKQASFLEIQNQNILAFKKHRELQISVSDYQKNYELYQTIEFEKSFHFQFSNDGKYLVSWDYSQQLEIRKQQD